LPPASESLIWVTPFPMPSAATDRRRLLPSGEPGRAKGVSRTAAATPLFQRAVSRDVLAHLAKGFRRRDVGCKLLL
jgi:hypothetical protein